MPSYGSTIMKLNQIQSQHEEVLRSVADYVLAKLSDTEEDEERLEERMNNDDDTYDTEFIY